MVVFLVLNLGNRPLYLGSADAEGSVTFLPFKLSISRKRVVYPFRRPAFDQLHGLRKNSSLKEATKAHEDDQLVPPIASAFIRFFSGYSSDVRPQVRFQFQIDEGITLFRAEGAMHEVADIRDMVRSLLFQPSAARTRQSIVNLNPSTKVAGLLSVVRYADWEILVYSAPQRTFGLLADGPLPGLVIPRVLNTFACATPGSYPP
jgi:hypothetical protein